MTLETMTAAQISERDQLLGYKDKARLNGAWAGDWLSFNHSSPVTDPLGFRMGWIMDGTLVAHRRPMHVNLRLTFAVVGLVVFLAIFYLLVSFASSAPNLAAPAKNTPAWTPTGVVVDLEAPTDVKAISPGLVPAKKKGVR